MRVFAEQAELQNRVWSSVPGPQVFEQPPPIQLPQLHVDGNTGGITGGTTGHIY